MIKILTPSGSGEVDVDVNVDENQSGDSPSEVLSEVLNTFLLPTYWHIGPRDVSVNLPYQTPFRTPAAVPTTGLVELEDSELKSSESGAFVEISHIKALHSCLLQYRCTFTQV